MATIVIDGITYVILSQKDYVVTPEENPGLKNSVTRTRLWLKRPRGKRTYIAFRYENGSVSSVV